MKFALSILLLAGLLVRPVLAQPAPITLEYRWIAGDTFTVISSADLNSHLHEGKHQAPSDERLLRTAAWRWTVRSVDGAGTAVIDARLLFFALSDQHGRSIFDSRTFHKRSIPDAAAVAMLPAWERGYAPYLRALEGKGLALHVGTTGEVVAVDGLDETTDLLRDATEAAGVNIPERIRIDPALQALASPRAFSEMMVPLTSQSVAVGATWRQRLDFDLGGSALTLTRRFRVDAISPTDVRIAIDGEAALPAAFAGRRAHLTVQPGTAEFALGGAFVRSASWGLTLQVPASAAGADDPDRLVEQATTTWYPDRHPEAPYHAVGDNFSASFPCTVEVVGTRSTQGGDTVGPLYRCTREGMFRVGARAVVPADRSEAGVAAAMRAAAAASVAGAKADGVLFRDPKSEQFHGRPAIVVETDDPASGTFSRAFFIAGPSRIYLVFAQIEPHAGGDEAAADLVQAFFDSFRIEPSPDR
ncbi:MAG: hypothetical protein ABR975_15305 [Vulcanimicrobiaceae bacterium]|jgi:hypothetical protein